MARLSLIDPGKTDGDVAKAFASMPVQLNIFRMMAHAETCMIPQMRLGGAILAKQDLDHGHRELLILLVARLEGGEYEWRQHVPIAEGVGVSEEKIAALDTGSLSAACFDDAELALLAFGKQVIENVRVEDAVFFKMKAHFSEREIVEAILAIGFYMTMARLTEATQTDLDPAAGMTVFNTTQEPPSQSNEDAQ